MEFSKEKIDKFATTVNIELTPSQQVQFAKDLKEMTQWIDSLPTVDIEKNEPLLTLSSETNKLSEDIPEKPIGVRSALQNAPKHDGAYFHVPNITVKPEKNTNLIVDK